MYPEVSVPAFATKKQALPEITQDEIDILDNPDVRVVLREPIANIDTSFLFTNEENDIDEETTSSTHVVQNEIDSFQDNLHFVKNEIIELEAKRSAVASEIHALEELKLSLLERQKQLRYDLEIESASLRQKTEADLESLREATFTRLKQHKQRIIQDLTQKKHQAELEIAFLIEQKDSAIADYKKTIENLTLEQQQEARKLEELKSKSIREQKRIADELNLESEILKNKLKQDYLSVKQKMSDQLMQIKTANELSVSRERTECHSILQDIHNEFSIKKKKLVDAYVSKLTAFKTAFQAHMVKKQNQLIHEKNEFDQYVQREGALIQEKTQELQSFFKQQINHLKSSYESLLVKEKHQLEVLTRESLKRKETLVSKYKEELKSIHEHFQPILAKEKSFYQDSVIAIEHDLIEKKEKLNNQYEQILKELHYAKQY